MAAEYIHWFNVTSGQVQIGNRINSHMKRLLQFNYELLMYFGRLEILVVNNVLNIFYIFVFVMLDKRQRLCVVLFKARLNCFFVIIVARIKLSAAFRAGFVAV